MLNDAAFTAGKVGQAFSFPDLDAFVSVAEPFRSFESEITVEYLIKISVPNNGAILGQGSENLDRMDTNVWLRHLNPSPNGRPTLTWYVNDNGIWRTVETPSLDLNTWHHIAGVSDRVSTRMYLNGVLVNQSPGITQGIRINPKSVVRLGNDLRFPGRPSFVGALDEVTVYNRALTGPEIQAIHDAGAEGKFVPPRPGPASLPNNAVSWWKGEAKAAIDTDDSVGDSPGLRQNGVGFVSGKVGHAFNQY